MSMVHSHTPELDPGYIESLRTRTRLAEIRKPGILIAVVPVAVFIIVSLIVSSGDAPGWALLLPLLAAAVSFGGDLYLLRGVVPLPAAIDQRTAALVAVETLRRLTLHRLAVTTSPLVLGFLVSVVVGSLLPYALAFLFAWPQVLRALPNQRVIGEVRGRLEAQGASSALWESLLQPAG